MMLLYLRSHQIKTRQSELKLFKTIALSFY